MTEENNASPSFPVSAEQVFEAKLLNFEDDWRIKLCESCLLRAIQDNFVIQSSATPIKQQKVDICIKCGHLKLDPWRGYCKHEVSPFGKRPVTYCGCVCEFPAATPTPVEQERDGFADLLPLTAVRIAPGEYEVKSRDGRTLWRMEGAALADWVCASVSGYDAALNTFTEKCVRCNATGETEGYGGNNVQCGLCAGTGRKPIFAIASSPSLAAREAEIREVLEGFRPREDRYAGGWCWCDKDLTNDRQPHSKHCETVNALYGKLAPLQIENPPDTLRE